MDKNSKVATGVVVAVVAAVLAYGAFILWLTWPISEYSVERAGQFGDSFGVLTSVFSGLAFAGVIWTVLSQREELNITRKELQDQAFENAFFQMLRLHNEILQNIDLVRVDQSSRAPITTRGRDCFAAFVDELKNWYQKPGNTERSEHEKLKKAYASFWKKRRGELGHYFRFLYNVLRFLEEKKIEKDKFYVKLLRAQLSDQELFIIFYNCLFDSGANFKRYAISFDLFDNLRPNYLIREDHRQLLIEAKFAE